MTDNKQTDAAMRRRMWIRHRQDNAYFARRRWSLLFWDFVGGWFGMKPYYDVRH
jgi:hypothetical protein